MPNVVNLKDSIVVPMKWGVDSQELRHHMPSSPSKQNFSRDTKKPLEIEFMLKVQHLLYVVSLRHYKFLWL